MSNNEPFETASKSVHGKSELKISDLTDEIDVDANTDFLEIQRRWLRLKLNRKMGWLVIIPCSENRKNRTDFRNYGYWNYSIGRLTTLIEELTKALIELELKKVVA